MASSRSLTTVNGTSLLKFYGFAPVANWEELSRSAAAASSEVGMMTYSFTQISHDVACPRRYRHGYLDTYPTWSAGRRCGWPKSGRSTEPCARLTESGSARQRRSGVFLVASIG